LLHAAPMFHLADGASWVARNALGGTHVMVPSFTPAGVARAIEAHRVTDTLLVPTMIQMLVDDPATADADLSSIRSLVYGASPISQAVLERAAARLPGVRFTQAYGMTELSPVATLLQPEDHAVERLRRSAGRSAPQSEVRIVDDEDREVPRGTVGEIVSRGGHVMAGYSNRPEETAAAVRDGWMHTGDGGYMDDEGYVFVVDRIKDMIVSGGENVYSAEVENALATHAPERGVRGRPADLRRGQGPQAGAAGPARGRRRGALRAAQTSSRSNASSPTQTRRPSPSSVIAPSSSSESSRAAPRARFE
jgi:acyl-CoA synthetase (AMP-forming)/AMP-acid ligase II